MDGQELILSIGELEASLIQKLPASSMMLTVVGALVGGVIQRQQPNVGIQ